MDDTVISEVYEQIRALQRDATIELAVKMGELIVQRFYGGKLEAWREHGPKEASLRKLAAKFEDDESGLSAAGIYRVVAIYELDQRLNVSARKQLTVTHIRAVLGLPEAKQEELLQKAEKEAWSTRKIEERAAVVRKKLAHGRGRPPLPAFVKTIHRFEKLVDEGDEAFGGLDAVDELSEDEATRLYRAVTSMKLKCEELEKALQKKVHEFGDVNPEA